MAEGYNVLQVIERPTVSPGGGLQQTTVIYLETVAGNTGTVELPTKHYMALTATEEGQESLSQILGEKAASLDTAMVL